MAKKNVKPKTTTKKKTRLIKFNLDIFKNEKPKRKKK